MQAIQRQELREMLEKNDDVILVETLDEDHFRKFHLPGAVNVPVDDAFEEHITEAVPDKNTPVVVYCQNTECQASPKAARRMEELGYEKVYDYEGGKEDWQEAGLPVEK